MSPLFACFPVCLTFVALGLIGAVMLAFGLGNRIPGDDEPSAATADAKPYPPPPLWVFPVTLLILVLVMLVLAWYWPE
ncbi:hypothetical protein R5W24_005424 [Gemmata sp. JC717]|uniref:hypothetical protein n=1 Tax=Gemmata algarum TaxID=2975278 RepID=UPI0021BB5624|nr:hypothetical protein [Gemmata algarum]MDY3556261.1 hypothetical protein [Gemmata algarum]